jgi:uncharacterized protein YbjT (DUF2867 family)
VSANWVARLLSAAGAESALRAARIGVIGSADSDSEAQPVLDRVRLNPDGCARWLVLGWIGTHPDAKAAVSRRAWQIEEACRATNIPTLVLRCAPLVGAQSPLWRRLAHARPGAGAGRPFQPVLEDDVVSLIRHVASGAPPHDGWFEVAGPEIMTLGELAEHARRHASGNDAGEWEPDPDVLRELPLVEPEIWMRAFGIDAASVTQAASRWAA